MVPKIAAVMRDEVSQPWLKDAFYIRGIVRNRMGDYNPHEAIRIIKQAFEDGADVDDVKHVALQAHNWSSWVEAMRDIV